MKIEITEMGSPGRRFIGRRDVSEGKKPGSGRRMEAVTPRELTPEEQAELRDLERQHTVAGAFQNVRDAAEPVIEEVSNADHATERMGRESPLTLRPRL